jgi:hypothetical protein
MPHEIAALRQAQSRGDRRGSRRDSRRRGWPPSAATRSSCSRRERAGGQMRLTAQSPRRKEMIGIIDWRMANASALGVSSASTLGRAERRAGRESPDVVIVATGGLPHTEFC